MNDITTREWQGTKDKIKEFYDSVDYLYDHEPKQRIFVAEDGNKIAGIVRLENKNGINIIRGMQIKKKYQGRGSAKALWTLF